MMGRLRDWLFSVGNIPDRGMKVIRVLGTNFIVRGRRIKRTSRYNDPQKFPIESNKIVFRSDQNNYSCNPKYIAEEIIRRELPWKMVWIVDNNVLRYKDDFPVSVQLEMIDTDAASRECYTARVIIDNTWRSFLLAQGICKRPDQVYIQTWHGSYGIKKFGLARHNFGIERWRQVERDFGQMDFFISNSDWESMFYQNTLRIPVSKILPFGHPRNDILFRKDEYAFIRGKVYRKLGIPEYKKMLLYAPTRNDERPASAYAIDVSCVLDACARKWGGDWVCAVRLTTKGELFRYLPDSPNIVSTLCYSDMQELLVAADVCISDYSSCIFDYLHTDKPAFIFATDSKAIGRNRGLYFPLSETPFSVAEDNKTLIADIMKFDPCTFKNRVLKFLQAWGSFEDGRAAGRVVDYLETIINPSIQE